MKKLFIVFNLIWAAAAGFSQVNPELFNATPKKIINSRILVAYPKKTWLENLVIGNDGMIYTTDYPAGKVYRISMNGRKEIYATIPGKIAGIALLNQNEFLVTGWDEQNIPSLFKINPDRKVSRELIIKGGMFPNGIIHFYKEKYLIADSYAGCIWLYDGATHTLIQWLKNEFLERSSSKSVFPAANGLKIYKNDLYISNTEKQILVKILLDHHKPQAPVIYLDKVNIDDFTFDNSGNIYAATNIYNCLIKITPAGNVSIIAGLDQGMAGCTAVVSKRNELNQTVLYVSTSGGMAVPPAGGIEEGKIVELQPD